MGKEGVIRIVLIEVPVQYSAVQYYNIHSLLVLRKITFSMDLGSEFLKSLL